MTTEIKLPSNAELAIKIIDADRIHKQKQLDIGWIGRFIGIASEKPGNVASIVIAISLITIVAVIFFNFNTQAEFEKKDIVAVLAGFITLSLGYLFGKSSNN